MIEVNKWNKVLLEKLTATQLIKKSLIRRSQKCVVHWTPRRQWTLLLPGLWQTKV